jgi:hypothetical protein
VQYDGAGWKKPGSHKRRSTILLAVNTGEPDGVRIATRTIARVETMQIEVPTPPAQITIDLQHQGMPDGFSESVDRLSHSRTN